MVEVWFVYGYYFGLGRVLGLKVGMFISFCKGFRLGGEFVVFVVFYIW